MFFDGGWVRDRMHGIIPRVNRLFLLCDSPSLDHDSVIALLELISMFVPLLPTSLQTPLITQIDDYYLALLSRPLSNPLQASSHIIARWLFTPSVAHPSIPQWVCHILTKLHTPDAFICLQQGMTTRKIGTNLMETWDRMENEGEVKNSPVLSIDIESDSENENENDERKRRRKELFRAMLQSISKIAQRHAQSDKHTLPSDQADQADQADQSPAFPFLSDTNLPIFVALLLKSISQRIPSQQSGQWTECIIHTIVEKCSSRLETAFKHDPYMQGVLQEVIIVVLRRTIFYRHDIVVHDITEFEKTIRSIVQFIEFIDHLALETGEINKLNSDLYNNVRALILERKLDISLPVLQFI